ncbi:DNA polymerase III, beta subunit [Prosthecochloris aestuarii DSM 271]|uniref:Beta sliding clamp n=3 Tax=Prosthecochloris TaxID=1101 RepID=B4S936_PROA2|nr:DNA polymerase III, beta subunit [Prosthecochloris aestuarii DSM 271]
MMKFSTSIKHFQDAVNKVTQAIPAKALDPRYENLHLFLDNGSLTLYATDGELSITATTEVESTDQGSFGMKARTILEFLRSMYDTSVTFNIERQQLSDQGLIDISTDKGRYRIPCSFESKQEKKDKDFDLELTLTSADLLDIIQKTIFACSVDGMRPAMMGVLLELENNKITAVSTDGHRLVRCIKTCESGVETKKRIVIPARVLSILQKLTQDDTVTLSIDTTNNSVRFVFPNLILDAALIVEQYPNYEAVIPLDNEKIVSINRSTLYDSVRRVGKFSSIGDIRISVAESVMTLMAENTNEGESAQEEIACVYSGEDLVIGFNSKFIEAALGHIETETITMELSSPTTAVILKPEKEEEQQNLIILVMPVRINN